MSERERTRKGGTLSSSKRCPYKYGAMAIESMLYDGTVLFDRFVYAVLNHVVSNELPCVRAHRASSKATTISYEVI